MRKRIQLRGISRTPSDRYTADGGLSESLNLQLEDNETAPVLVPEDITSRYGAAATAGLPGPTLFIHKGRGYNNLVFQDISAGSIKAYAENSIGNSMLVYSLQQNEEVHNVTSIGNTLVISTNQRIEYILYKDGSYHDLGDQVPIPSIEFRTRQYNAGQNGGIALDTSAVTTILVESYDPTVDPRHLPEEDRYDPLMIWDVNAWNSFKRGQINRVPGSSQNSLEDSDAYNEINNILWEMISRQVKYVKEHGYFATPVFARYALRLYDGSYMYQSVPVLVGASDKKFFTAQGMLLKNANDSNWSSYLKVQLISGYLIKAYLQPYNYEGWEDIVSSIDIFLSTDIHNPLLNAKITGITLDETGSESGQRTYYDLSFEAGAEEDESERVRNEMLSKTLFYRIASFDVGKTEKLEGGYNLMSQKEFTSQDYLVTQPTLPDDYLSFHRKTSDSLFRYNNKVMMAGVTTLISPGYPYLNGSVIRQDFQAEEVSSYDFKFYLRDPSNNVLTVMGRGDDGNIGISAYQEPEPSERSAKSFGWIAYPDTRCFKVDVKITKGEDVFYRSYKMEAHPGLNCAFAFIGLDQRIGIDGGEELDPSAWEATEQRTYKEDNVIWASLMDNPFVFPLNGRLTFLSEVIALANATIALSEGQFGQYPIYVFTKDGIWSVPVSDEGDFAASVPLSRDVLVSKDAIQPIEQAIVFVSAQGVMLLQGSAVSCISENMNGENYNLSDDLLTLLGYDFVMQPYSQAYNSRIPFNQFVRQCRIAYDYSGRRLLFFGEGGAYAYVYRLTSQTWHKISLLGQSLLFDSPLNSYPDCWIGMRNGSTYKVCDFSVEYDGTGEQNTLPGLTVSRPFDLEEPDVRKSITALRIRGKYNRLDAKYVLLGSMDGINWGILSSLRGGSYKLFRIAILTNLQPEERITWIDVEYETRFANRMR